MKKILFVFGTRPEAIKMAPVINIFKENFDSFKTTILVTGQHREMLDQVLNVFKIKPDYVLGNLLLGEIYLEESDFINHKKAKKYLELSIKFNKNKNHIYYTSDRIYYHSLL